MLLFCLVIYCEFLSVHSLFVIDTNSTERKDFEIMKNKDYLIYYLDTAITDHEGFAVIPGKLAELLINRIESGSFTFDYDISEYSTDEVTMRFADADTKNPLTLDVNYSGISSLASEGVSRLLQEEMDCGNVLKEDLINIFGEGEVLRNILMDEKIDVEAYLGTWMDDIEDGYLRFDTIAEILDLYFEKIYKPSMEMNKKVSIVLDNESLEFLKSLIQKDVINGIITKTIT